MPLNHVEKITMPDDLPPTFAQPKRHQAPAVHFSRCVEKMMKSQKTDPNAQSQRSGDQEIEERYGAIGIAAVAAAVRYQSLGRAKPSPGPHRIDERFEQAA